MEDKEERQEEPEKYFEDEKEEPKISGFGVFLAAIFDFIKTIVIVVLLALVIRLFIIQPFIVEGQSMEPSFHNNDYLITEKVSYKIRAPKHGEIVIFQPPDRPGENYIKRIIGLPGDTVEIKEGSVFLNGSKLDEKYLKSNNETIVPKDSQSKITLGQDQYFVFGDNRNHSRDSRELGPIPKSHIVSRIWIRLLPLDSIKAFAAVNY